MPKRTVALVILDGWGIGRNDPTNAIYIAQPENINYIKSHYLAGSLQASGIAVGLPWGEEGNSEVGHLTIGAGKVIYQHFPRITLAIRNGTFFQNKILTEAIEHAVKNKSSLNLLGLFSQGNVHASFEHLTTIIQFAQKLNVTQVNLHLFADGKDSSPKSFLDLLEKLNKQIPLGKQIKLATVIGRHYALDRDRHWDRTQQAYDVLVGKGTPVADVKEYINYQYQRGLTDQYLEPTLIGPEINCIKDNDALLFFDFREDSVRQITAAFASPAEALAKEGLTVTQFKNLYLATMTQYSDRFVKAHVLFSPEKIEAPLSAVLSENNKMQLRVAETEKYAHVTYFFNGLKDAPLKNEYRILVPSRNIVHHDEHPEMMAEEIGNRVTQAIEEGEMDFILVNFANPDIIAHTGNFEAAVKAIKITDEQIGKITKVALAKNTVVIITSDHGNAERMIDPLTGVPETKHDPNPVPIYLVGKEFEKQKDPATVSRIENETSGILSDVAPTVLELMGLPKPAEMSGESLVNRLD